MGQVHVKGNIVETVGHAPKVHMKAANFSLVDKDLKERTLQEFQGKRKVIATVPSMDTEVCSIMTKHLNEFAKKHSNIVVLVISADLPFAQKRFCEAENVHNSHILSTIREPEFGKSYGVLIKEGALKGLLARAIFILDEKDHVLYEEIVDEVTKEPNYHKAFEVVQGHHKK